jgi:hypothetical protein
MALPPARQHGIEPHPEVAFRREDPLRVTQFDSGHSAWQPQQTVQNEAWMVRSTKPTASIAPASIGWAVASTRSGAVARNERPRDAIAATVKD